MMPEFVSDRKLFLNADKSAVVDEDSPDAAFVLVGEGGTVSHEDAERYGLTAPSTQSDRPALSNVEEAAEDGEDAEDGEASDAPRKAGRSAQHKAVRPQEDKGG